MIMDNFQLIILIVTILGSVFAQSRIILGRLTALEDRVSAVESRLSAVESRLSHMEGLFEGFRAAGILSSSQSDKNQTQAA